MTVTRGPRRGFASAYNSSIANKPNCGGNKKTGLAPTVGKSTLLMLRPAYNRAYKKHVWPRECKLAVDGGATAFNKDGQPYTLGPMPLSRNPACSGGVGRHPSATTACGIWRW